eukprot:1379209-Pyramimonas_sp.AAC.1
MGCAVGCAMDFTMGCAIGCAMCHAMQVGCATGSALCRWMRRKLRPSTPKLKTTRSCAHHWL